MPSTRNISTAALSLLLMSLPSSQAHLQTRNNATSDAATTCATLYSAYPGLTYFSNETTYTTLNEGMHLLSSYASCIRTDKYEGK